MEPVLRCKDRWGREILLSEATGLGHIVWKHGELFAGLDRIKQAVEQADSVHHDVHRKDREAFYRLAGLREPYRHLYLKVIVEFTQTENGVIIGHVVTAFPAHKVKPDEVRRWP